MLGALGNLYGRLGTNQKGGTPGGGSLPDSGPSLSGLLFLMMKA